MIGLFDSGIGGLTLLHETRKYFPNEIFLYYADTKNVPYSYKKPEDVVSFVEEGVAFMLQKGCKAIVLACNTATNLTVEPLRAKHPHVPIVAIQPAIKVAIDNNFKHKRILTFATPITLKSARFLNLVKKYDLENKIDTLPLPGLVELAEKEVFDSYATDYLREQLAIFDLTQYEYVVLGCTHFTFFKKNFIEIAPHLIPVDGNTGTARHLKNVLQQLSLINSTDKSRIEFYESGRKVTDTSRFERYLSLLDLLEGK